MAIWQNKFKGLFHSAKSRIGKSVAEGELLPTSRGRSNDKRKRNRTLRWAVGIELLEDRVMLASDFMFDGATSTPGGFDATLTLVGTDLVLRDNLTNTVLQSQPLADHSGFTFILGSQQADRLTLDASIPSRQY